MRQLLLTMIALMTFGFSYAQQDAGTYMNQISDLYKEIQKDMWDYTSEAAHGKNAKKIEQKRQELIQTTYETRGQVRTMKDWEGNTAYRDSVVSFLNIYYLVLKEDYAKIVDMEEIAERSYDLMEAYMLTTEEANNKLTAASDMLQSEQKKFADEFGVEIVEVEDDLSKKMKIADEVYAYYNDLYLIFFKAYVADIYLSEAINKGDVNAIEQNKNALSTATEESLAAIASFKDFNGDNSINAGCKAMLEFYKKEADEMIGDITDFHIKEENFNNIKSSFEQKKDSDRTQEDVDQYNNAVNDYNAAGQAYNAANQQINDERTKLLGQWNDAVARFIDKHVPKGKAK